MRNDTRRAARLRASMAAIGLVSAIVSVATLPAHAQDPAPVRITVLTDLDGDLYDARSGAGGVDATRMAVADFGGTVLGRPIVVDTRNDHNKPDLVKALAEDAYDKGADLLMDVQNSPIAVAASKVAAERHRLAIVTLAATPALTRSACNKYTYHYSFDAPAIASATAESVAKLQDGKRWVALVADAGFGKSAVAAFTPTITAQGGEVVKTFLLPVGDADLAPILKRSRGASSRCGRRLQCGGRCRSQGHGGDAIRREGPRHDGAALPQRRRPGEGRIRGRARDGSLVLEPRRRGAGLVGPLRRGACRPPSDGRAGLPIIRRPRNG